MSGKHITGNVLSFSWFSVDLVSHNMALDLIACFAESPDRFKIAPDLKRAYSKSITRK